MRQVATSVSCLTPLPLAALRLSHETVAALARLGLKRIGDILDLPRAPLAARFGADLLRQLDRALGREHEPLTPRLPVAPYVAEQAFTSRSRARRTCSPPSSGSRRGSRRR